MFTSSGSTGGGRHGGGNAKTIISPNTSFGDIMIKILTHIIKGLSLNRNHRAVTSTGK